MAARSKAWIHGRSLAGIPGANCARGMVFCLFVVSAATDRSLIQRVLLGVRVSEYDRKTAYRKPRSTKIVEPGGGGGIRVVSQMSLGSHISRSNLSKSYLY